MCLLIVLDDGVTWMEYGRGKIRCCRNVGWAWMMDDDMVTIICYIASSALGREKIPGVVATRIRFEILHGIQVLVAWW